MSKEYILIVKEEQIDNFRFLMNLGAQFLEVQGMGIGDNGAAMLLATPVKPPVTPMQMPERPPQPAPETPAQGTP